MKDSLHIERAPLSETYPHGSSLVAAACTGSTGIYGSSYMGLGLSLAQLAALVSIATILDPGRYRDELKQILPDPVAFGQQVTEAQVPA